MDASLALTGLLMGLAGGAHCLAMCGPVCAALGRTDRVSVLRYRPGFASRLCVPSVWAFQLGRLMAYCAAGALAAGSVQALGWLSVQSAVLRPVWTFMHAGAAVLGALLLWRGQQPAWLDQAARRVWRRVAGLWGDRTGPPEGRAAWALGLGWAFLPCGLLYSALMVAALGSSLSAGALTMALFAVGSSLGLVLGPWLWWRGVSSESNRWAVRLSGAALMAMSGWALWRALVEERAPWCLSPSAL